MKSKGSPRQRSEPQIHAFLEKRKYLRNPFFVVELKWKKYDKIFLAKTENISLGGAFMSTDHPLQVGEQFPLEFVLPGRKTKIDCVGEVTWTRRYSSEGAGSEGVGIRFVNLDARKIKAIGQWIQTQENRPKEKA